jgi:hypothetical protein
MDLTGRDPARVGWQLGRSPLGPPGVHLLSEESLLCQLQSCLRAQVSRIIPAVRDQFLVRR